MSTPSMPPAWYPDPSLPGQLRWWDGGRWTEHVSRPQNEFAGVSPGGPTGTRYAGFWERFGAYVIDSFVLGIPLMILFVMFGWGAFMDYLDESVDAVNAGKQAEPDSSGLVAALLPMILLAVVVQAAYFIGMLGKYGRTLGQRALAIRVVEAHGGMPTYATAGMRWLIPGGLGLVGVVPVIGSLASLAVFVDYLSMLWDKQNQCWHDKFARTWVVHETERPAYNPYG